MSHENDELLAAVEGFFTQNRSLVPPGNNPEWLSARARDFFSRQEQIVDRMIEAPEEVSENGFYLYREPIGLYGIDRLSLRVAPSVLPPTFEATDITLTHQTIVPKLHSNPIVHISELAQFNTTTSLRLGRHMDEPTQEQVQRLLDTDSIRTSDTFTLVLFAPNGDHKQISALPRSVIDPLGREDLGNTNIPVKLVLSDFTDTSVDIVDRALAILEDYSKLLA